MSIVVIFLLLYMQFRNASQSGVILLNLPLALIGGVFALLCTTGEVSIPAIIGFISLFGIATRNGMLLISHYNTLRDEQGMGLRESILRGSLDRLNPILMTALSSALALIPLAFAWRSARQRNPESDGKGYPGRFAYLNFPQCFCHPYCVRTDEPQEVRC